MTQADGKAQWERPPEGMIKINTDGALFEDSNTYSYSMIVRNHAGDLVESKASCRQGTVNPEMAELMGIREALSWLKDKDYAGAIVETGKRLSGHGSGNQELNSNSFLPRKSDQ